MARELDMSFDRPIWDPNRFPPKELRKQPAKARLFGRRAEDKALRRHLLLGVIGLGVAAGVLVLMFGR